MALTEPSCADTETTSLYSLSHWMSYFDLGLVLGQLSLWRPDMFQAYSFRDSPLLSKLSYLHSYPEQGLIPRYTGSQSPSRTRQGWSHSPVNSVWLSGGEECAERAEQLGSPAAESPVPGWGCVVSLWPRRALFPLFCLEQPEEASCSRDTLG